MKRHISEPPKMYKNASLMNELNDMMIMVKVHLFDELKEARKIYSKPTVKDIDDLHFRIEQELKKGGSVPHVRY